MLEFRPPKRKKIVIFDGHGSEHVSMCLPKKSYVILHTRYEKINFFILFKCLLNLKFKYRDYLKEFINYVKPKILLTYIDNNYFFYQIKFKFLKKISLQNGHRTEISQDFFYQIKNKKLNLNSDFIFFPASKTSVSITGLSLFPCADFTIFDFITGPKFNFDASLMSIELLVAPVSIFAVTCLLFPSLATKLIFSVRPTITF